MSVSQESYVCPKCQLPELICQCDNLAGCSSFESGAYFSPESEWRYALWRNWETDAKAVMFIGLNPSIADEIRNDTTISKCIGFAKRWGFGGIYMVNLFALVSTDPHALLAAGDPIGPGNDEALKYYAKRVELVVAAWGTVPVKWRPRLSWQSRIDAVLKLIGRDVECLGRTQDGSPRHPSRISYETSREAFGATYAETDAQEGGAS